MHCDKGGQVCFTGHNRFRLSSKVVSSLAKPEGTTVGLKRGHDAMDRRNTGSLHIRGKELLGLVLSVSPKLLPLREWSRLGSRVGLSSMRPKVSFLLPEGNKH